MPTWLIGLSALGVGFLIALVPAVFLLRLQREVIDIVKMRTSLFEELAREYQEAYGDQLTISKNALTEHNETLKEFHQSLVQFKNHRPEEWGLLYTLCDILDHSGTEFEDGSVIGEWWRSNKGKLNEEGDRG